MKIICARAMGAPLNPFVTSGLLRALGCLSVAAAFATQSLETLAAPLALEEIIVTASKRSESLQNVPITVTAFSAEHIDEAGINDSKDLAILTPSLTVTTNSQPFNAAFRIRGLGTAQTDTALEPSVGLFVDDVYLARSGLGMSDITDIERIEVLQGPQGTLYGKNTNAGAINIITKGPNTQEHEGYAEVTAGNYALRKVILASSGPITDTLAYRVSGNIHKRDGYFNNIAGPDMNTADDWNWIAKLLYQPTEDLGILLNANRVDRNTRCCAADITQNDIMISELTSRGLPVIPNDPFDYKIAVDVPSEFKYSAKALSMVVDYQLDWGSIKSISAWNDASGFATRDVDMSQLDVVSQIHGVSNGDSFSQEVRVASNGDGEFAYQAGAFFFSSTVQGGDNTPWTFLGEDSLEITALQPGIGELIPFGLPVELVAQVGDSIRADVNLKTTNVALFGQTQWHVNERWQLTGGLRYTREEKDANLLTAIDSTAFSAQFDLSLFNAATTPIDDDFTRHTDDVNWLLSSSYDLGEDVMLFASIATGSKSGGFNTVNGTAQEREFDDESTTALELGVKSLLLDNRLRVNATAFYTEVEEYQIQEQLESGIGTRVSNLGEVETSGLDVSVEAIPLPNLTLTAGVLYMHRYRISGGPNEGEKLPFTADFSGTVAATLVLPVADGGVYIRTDYSYMDDHLTTAAAQFDDNDIQKRQVLNLRFGFRNDQWHASIWGKNLTEDEYAALTLETFPLTGADGYYLTPPRTYGATVRYSF